MGEYQRVYEELKVEAALLVIVRLPINLGSGPNLMVISIELAVR